MKKPTIDSTAFLAPGAKVMGDVTLACGCSVWYNAVIRGDLRTITVGENTNIQDCCVLHTDAGNNLTVGAGCTVGHGAVLHGCEIGSNTLIGMGSTVLSGAKIGADCIVGGGSLVTGKLHAPDGSMILGNPAKVVRPLSLEEIESIHFSCRQYLGLADLARQREKKAEA